MVFVTPIGLFLSLNVNTVAKVKLNEGYYKAGLDRCIAVAKIVQMVLLDHPAIDQNQQLCHLIQGSVSEINAVGNLLTQKTEDNSGMLYDRAMWMFELVSELLVCHPVIEKDKEAKKLANKAADYLWKLYQHHADETFLTDEERKANRKLITTSKGIRSRTKRKV